MLKSFVDLDSVTETCEAVEETDLVDGCNGGTEAVEKEEAYIVIEYHLKPFIRPLK